MHHIVHSPPKPELCTASLPQILQVAATMVGSDLRPPLHSTLKLSNSTPSCHHYPDQPEPLSSILLSSKTLHLSQLSMCFVESIVPTVSPSNAVRKGMQRVPMLALSYPRPYNKLSKPGAFARAVFPNLIARSTDTRRVARLC